MYSDPTEAFQRDWPVGDDNAVFNDLDAKINYAITRWGASIFYIDSNSWPNDAFWETESDSLR